MGLYLCVFADSSSDDELDGIDLGAYDDFHLFRSTVATELEAGNWGSRFPVLMQHSDSDGEWTPREAAVLIKELEVIAAGMAELPAVELDPTGWQFTLARSIGLVPVTLADCFFDIDGEPLIGRLIALAVLAIEHSAPICFQ